MTNLDEFFGGNPSQNVETLIAVTKKFYVFVSQLAEIVDDLERKYTDLGLRLKEGFDSQHKEWDETGLSSPLSDRLPDQSDEGNDKPSFPLREAVKNLRNDLLSLHNTGSNLRNQDQEDPPTPFIYVYPYPKGPPVASAEGHLKILVFCPRCGEQNTLHKTKCAYCHTSLLPSR